MTQEDKFIMLNMDDPKLKKVSEVLSNKTAKRIIDYLADKKDASEKDIADALEIPLNTVEYNINKLIDAGIVQKHKDFFWSKKGKKIVMYELSRKSIVISPRGSDVDEKLKSLVPGFLVIGALTFATYVYEKMKFNSINDVALSVNGAPATLQVSKDIALEESANLGVAFTSNLSGSPLWQWFLLGGLVALGIVALVNWRKL